MSASISQIQIENITTEITNIPNIDLIETFSIPKNTNNEIVVGNLANNIIVSADLVTVNNVTQVTQSTITTTYTYDASSANISYDLATPLAVTQGDKIELRWTTPTWVTNPTTVRQQMNVYLEY